MARLRLFRYELVIVALLVAPSAARSQDAPQSQTQAPPQPQASSQPPAPPQYPPGNEFAIWGGYSVDNAAYWHRDEPSARRVRAALRANALRQTTHRAAIHARRDSGRNRAAVHLHRVHAHTEHDRVLHERARDGVRGRRESNRIETEFPARAPFPAIHRVHGWIRRLGEARARGRSRRNAI